MGNPERKIDVNAVCRTCHHRLEADKSVDIFANGSTTAKQLEMCHLSIVSSEDDKPKKMCLHCAIELEKTTLFMAKCLDKDEKMDEYLLWGDADILQVTFDDDNSEKYVKSIQTIEKLTQQLGEDQNHNGNSKQPMDFELEKKRILNEAQVKFAEKLKAVQASAKRNLKQKLEELEAEHEMKLERIAKNVQEQIVSAGKRKRVDSSFDFMLESTSVGAPPNLDSQKKQTVPRAMVVNEENADFPAEFELLDPEMVKNFTIVQQTKTRKNWANSEELKDALDAIWNNGMKMTDAALAYNVPYMVLYNYDKGICGKAGNGGSKFDYLRKNSNYS